MFRCTCAEFICPAWACAESGFTYVVLAHVQSLVLHMSCLCRRRVWFYICLDCAGAESGFYICPACACAESGFYICPACACAESGFYICPACACAESGFTYVPRAHAQSLFLHMSRLLKRTVWVYICPAWACVESGFLSVPLAHAQSLRF
jgi:hypothetical protein